MAEVFISYSRNDSDFVHVLDEHLKREGRDVWVDWEDIAPAADWQQDIYDNIDAAESFVFVVSAKSLESQYCGKELVHAQERGKRIIPIACDAADPNTAPTALAQLNWIWCGDGDDRDIALAKLSSALETDLVWAKAHTRLLVKAVEWDARGDGSLLLRGADLREAEQNLAANAGWQPAPTELQQRYVLASRRAAARRQRIMLGSAGIALAVSIGLGILALLQRNDARAATRSAGALAGAESASNPETPLDLSLLLGYAAYRTKPGVLERSSVLTALETAHQSGVVRIFRGHTAAVLGVAFNADGHTLASAGADGTVRLWDARGGSQPTVLYTGVLPVNGVAFSRNGSMLASAGANGTVRLWDVHARREHGVLRGSRASINAVAFGRGNILASAGADGSVRVWNVDSRRQVDVIHTGAGPANAVAFSRDGRRLAYAADGPKNGSGVVRLWDTRAHRLIGRPMHQRGGYRALGVAFSADGKTLASAGADGIVRLWQVPSGKLVAASASFSAIAMYSVAFSPDGHTLASSSADGSIYLWTPGTLKSMRTLTGQQGDVYGVAFGPGGRTLVSAGADRTVRLWDIGGQPDLAQGAFVTGVAFGSGGHTIVASNTGRDAVRFWNLRTGRPSIRLDRPINGVESIAVSRRAGLLATGDSHGTIRLWDLHGHLRGQMNSGSEEVRGLAFSRDGRVLASANADDTIQTWNVRTKQPTPTAKKPLHRPVDWDYGTNTVAFSPNGKWLASGGDGYTVRLWNLRTRQTVRRFQGDTSWIAAVAFSPNGRTLATADWDGTVRLWNVRAGKQIRDPLRGHFGPVEAVAFSPDGSMLASGGNDSTVRLWDVRTHQQLGQPMSAGRKGYAVNSVAFSPSGRTLVAGSADGTVRIWRGIFWRDLDDLRGKICSLVAGNLTRAEVHVYAPGLPYAQLCPA